MKNKIKRIGNKLQTKCPNCKEEIYLKPNDIMHDLTIGICPGCGQYLMLDTSRECDKECIYKWGKSFVEGIGWSFTKIYNKDGKTEKDTL